MQSGACSCQGLRKLALLAGSDGTAVDGKVRNGSCNRKGIVPNDQVWLPAIWQSALVASQFAVVDTSHSEARLFESSDGWGSTTSYICPPGNVTAGNKLKHNFYLLTCNGKVLLCTPVVAGGGGTWCRRCSNPQGSQGSVPCVYYLPSCLLAL